MLNDARIFLFCTSLYLENNKCNGYQNIRFSISFHKAANKSNLSSEKKVSHSCVTSVNATSLSFLNHFFLLILNFFLYFISVLIFVEVVLNYFYCMTCAIYIHF